MKTARPNDTTRANSFTTAPRNRVITDRDLSEIIGFAHPAMLRSIIRRNVAGLALRGSCRPTEQSGFHLNQSQALYLVSVAPLAQTDPGLIAAVSRVFRAET